MGHFLHAVHNVQRGIDLHMSHVLLTFPMLLYMWVTVGAEEMSPLTFWYDARKSHGTDSALEDPAAFKMRIDMAAYNPFHVYPFSFPLPAFFLTRTTVCSFLSGRVSCSPPCVHWGFLRGLVLFKPPLTWVALRLLVLGFFEGSSFIQAPFDLGGITFVYTGVF
jgi:hypothetical protein